MEWTGGGSRWGGQVGVVGGVDRWGVVGGVDRWGGILMQWVE